MTTEKYICENCGNHEFVTKPNQFDLFSVEDGKLVFQETMLVEDDKKIELFCFECDKKLEFDEEDLEF
ncbi:hypothetical protein [Bernardetia sp.]|uniref:hypothetical protein n=1 Tax=Bernardetia sp. TaxID=1937974 RepID=UPI0025C474EC|nr:hypothetical protein [Bernardetia sp.]